MDQMEFEWFNKNKDNIERPEVLDALVNQFSQNESTANDMNATSTGDLIEYLLQGNPLQQSNYAPLIEPVAAPVAPTANTTNNSNSTGGSFFTFVSTASTTSAPKRKASETTPLAAKGDAIFVTESPQTMYNKKGNSNGNKKSSQQNSSGEDGGSDDDMFEEIRSSASYKMMTSKEKRQLRNKISARNFRVRRKEYITQLEEKVNTHEETINKLKEENDKLRKMNEELMQQLLNQSITPPPSSNEASPPSSFDNSPESVPGSTLPNAFPFPFDDLYEFNLFDIPPTTQQQVNNNPDAALFINHMSVPDWNIPKVFDDKKQDTIFSSYGAIYDDAREIIHQYPLLAPALMSIVLRHTLSLEYVQAYAQELKEKTTKQEEEDKKSKGSTKKTKGFSIKYIEHAEQEDYTDEELSDYLLNYSFTRYVGYRMRGLSHEEVLVRARACLKGREQDIRQKVQNKLNKKQEQKKKKEHCEHKKNTLYTYCKVAGKLLRNPEHMAHVGSIIKQTQSEHYRQTMQKQIGNTSGMGSISSSLRNLRVSRA